MIHGVPVKTYNALQNHIIVLIMRLGLWLGQTGFITVLLCELLRVSQLVVINTLVKQIFLS